jgi:hypothetical protein
VVFPEKISSNKTGVLPGFCRLLLQPASQMKFYAASELDNKSTPEMNLTVLGKSWNEALCRSGRDRGLHV